MCHYITLIAPTEDKAALHGVLEWYGRRAIPYSNPSIAKLLLPDEHQYLTYVHGCDCGTVLGWPKADREAAADDSLAHEEAKLRRKGWSEAKVRRALEDKRRVQARPPREPLDSYELWEKILTGIFAQLKLPRLGLLVHSYHGALDDETILAVRREVPKESSFLSALEDMSEDVLTVFARQREAVD